MKHSTLLGVAALVALFAAEPAAAQTRVFVSGVDSDANPCSLAAPCRSFQQAHNTVVAGAEIVGLDAAGYGPLTITKAVTVTAIGIEASITSNSTGGAALTISAGANDVVAIRGLTIIAGAQSNDGIDISSAKSVTIRDCSISGFPSTGIFVFPSAGLGVELRDVSVANSGADGLLFLPSGAGIVTASVTVSYFSGNGTDGVAIDTAVSAGTIKATLNIVADANRFDGIGVASLNGKAVVMVTGAKLMNNGGSGLDGSGNTKIFVDHTQITGNSGNGWSAEDSAAVISYQTNAVNGNGNDGLNGIVQITSN